MASASELNCPKDILLGLLDSKSTSHCIFRSWHKQNQDNKCVM